MTEYRSYAAAFSGTTTVNLLLTRRWLLKAGTTDLATDADWTPVAGDVTLSIDGGIRADVATLPTYTNGQWLQPLNAAELTGARVHLTVLNGALNDYAVVIETYGVFSPDGDNAQHPGVRVVDNNDKTGYALSGAFQDIFFETVHGTSVPETYQIVGEEPSMGQLLYMIWSVLSNFTYTDDARLITRALDGVTEAMTFTLDENDSPDGMTRAT